jgi:hypothetical protein
MTVHSGDLLFNQISPVYEDMIDVSRDLSWSQRSEIPEIEERDRRR